MSEKGLTLRDIDEQFREVEAILEASGGDLEQEMGGKPIVEWIERNEILHRDKVGAYCAYLKTLELDADKCKQMAKGYTDRAKVKLNTVERLTEALKQSMELRKIVKIDAPTNLIWIQKNGGKPPIVIKATLEQMPPQYRKTIPAQEVIDTEKLKQDALAGIPEALALCEVGEIGSSLRIK